MPHQDLIVDGIKYPSATELTYLLPQDWLWSWYKYEVKKHGWRGWLKCLATSQRGQRIGTEVHSLIEGFINKASVQVSGKYDSEAIADALFDVVNPKIDEYIAIEPHLINNKLKMQGTADLICRINGETGLWIGDWKTSSQKSNTHPIQLTIYAMCWNEQHPEQIIDQGFIARVDKKSKGLNVKMDEYKGLKQYYPIVKSLRLLYDYVHKTGDYNAK